MEKTRQELLQELLKKIHCVFRSMGAWHSFRIDGYKLNKPQVDILFLIAKQKSGVSVKDLASNLNVTPGAISQFSDILVEKGLIKREEDKKDRRVLKIKITDSALEKFKNFKKDYFLKVSPMFDTLEDQEIKQLVNLMSKVDVSSQVSHWEGK
ncbi:MarR family transcriptional regulator [Candidatus Daviesbacteria bacterium]|nr:MarR family transcriptional regulator [Candidatus Daviesbacteria bacterium]